MNRLVNETSPYLLQHANNPVDWYPWGKEALNKAEAENKMLLISIGYSACHWCHVMEHESFEDEEVAVLMNKNFVCIKVDREERPDVDQIYINAIQLLTQSGGWPLNCFALPDGRPVYGGTYFPRDSWIQLLNYMIEIYTNEPGKVYDQAEQLREGIKKMDVVEFKSITKQGYTKEQADDIFLSQVNSFDQKYGGFVGAPKFILPNSWLSLLRYGHSTGNHQILSHVDFTLHSIASGGIYDHIGGGFARYSVDQKWLVPHFEKMLYDNAQLISLYSEAYRKFGKSVYKEVVYETVRFIEEELESPEGLFYSALDADSEGEEGKFYVWTKAEIDKLLGKDSELFCAYYNITATGNWENGFNILHKTQGVDNIAGKFGLSPDEFRNKIEKSELLLKTIRNKRMKPGLDDKALTAWNGLMIKGLTDAYLAFKDEKFLDKAIKAIRLILEKQTDGNYQLYRNYKESKRSIAAFLDDYSAVVDALIGLYSCTFEEEWLQKAKNYTGYTFDNFYNRDSSMFFYTDKNFQDLIVRKMEITDNVIPSSNSMMAINLYMLGRYFDDEKYLTISKQMLNNISDNIPQYGRYYANWARLMLIHVFQNKEIAVLGENAEQIRKALLAEYIPDIIIAGSEGPSSLPLLKERWIKDKTLIYICENYACELPVESVEEALGMLSNRHQELGYRS